MSKKDFFNRTGGFIGQIEENHKGNMVAYDKNNRVIGYYDASMDQTYESDRSFYARGNMLSSLIMESAS
jgi:hypothetical protein